MIKDSLYTLLTRSLIIVLKLLYSVLINQTLGPVLKGAFELIQLAPDTLSRFGTFGFEHANIYFAGRRPRDIPKLISNSFRLTFFLSQPALILGAGYMLLPKNEKIFEYAPHFVGFLALIVIPVTILDMFIESILYGENRVWVRNLRETLRIISALIYIGTFVLGLGWAVTGAVFGYILVSITLLAVTLFIHSRFHRFKEKKYDPGLVSECFKYGRFTWGANFASYLFYKADIWLISAFAAGTDTQKLEQVGLYSTAVNIIVNIWIIPDAIQTALLPKITQKGESERKKLVPPSLRTVTLLVVIASIILAIIGKPALAFLYNRRGADWDFTKAYVPLILLMPGILTLSLAKVFTADFLSRGKPYYAMWVSLTSLVLNISLNLMLIPSTSQFYGLPIGGMNGAAIASSTSYTFSFLMFLYFYIRESGERARDIFLPKVSDFRLFVSWVKAWWNRSQGNDNGTSGESS